MSLTTVTVAGGVLALGNLVVGTSLIPALLGRGAPFVPTAGAKIEALFGSDGLLRPSSRRSLLPPASAPDCLQLIDLGSGDGALLRAATRVAGFGKATGWEINPFLVGYARLRSSGRYAREETRWHSLWDAPVAEADVVLVYGAPPIMQDLGAKLKAELRPGAVVVSNGYPLPPEALGPPIASVFVETPRWSSDASSCLFGYRWGGAARGRRWG
eukprot:scaffold1724_cov113-Isochrysis_galbana.AAC.3